MSKFKNYIPIITTVLIMLIGIISFAIRANIVETELEATKIDLQLKEDALIETQANLMIEIEKSNGLSASLGNMVKELENANIVIESFKSEEYIVETTVTAAEVEMIAKTVYGEARGLSTIEQSAVVWCILNYVDAGHGTIAEIITYPNRFHGYNSNFPITDEIRALVEDVIARWKIEKYSVGDVGRTLPKDYLYFHGDGEHNYFRNQYNGDYDIWDWDCYNPYS